MAWWIASIARSTRVAASASASSVGDGLQGEADGVQVLDDPVMEVLRDPVAFIDDGRR